MLRRLPLFATAAALLLILVVACGGGSADDSIPTSTPAAPTAQTCGPGWTAAPGLDAGAVMTADGERSYIMHVPAGYDGATPRPLLLMLHRAGGTGRNQYELSGVAAAADEHGAIVVLPEADGSPSYWNSRKSIDLADDVQFLTDLIAEVSSNACVDPSRVYAAGYSNGAGMALRLACDAPDMLAGVAVVAATYLPCQADLPMVAFHGSADLVVPFEGGDVPAELGAGSFPPVRRAVSEWARAAGCDGLPAIERPSDEIERSTFVNCPGEGEVVLYTVIGGGHTWPGAAAPLPEALGATTRQLSATETMLEFFEALSADFTDGKD